MASPTWSHFVTFIYEAHWLISSFHYTEKNSITCLHLENDSYVVRDACEIKKLCTFSEKVAKKEQNQPRCGTQTPWKIVL